MKKVKDMHADIFNVTKEPVWKSVKADAKIALTDAGLAQNIEFKR